MCGSIGSIWQYSGIVYIVIHIITDSRDELSMVSSNKTTQNKEDFSIIVHTIGSSIGEWLGMR